MEKYTAIADIHGCPQQLEEILYQVKEFPEHKLIFLGDYIDRGPDSESVIQRIKTLDATFLKGNHEAMLFSRISRTPDAKQRLLEQAKLSLDSFEWLEERLTPVHETKDYIFVHAGLDTISDLDNQSESDFLWTIHEGDYYGLTPKTVVHGHVIKDEVEIVGNRININTGCGNGGKLTAIVLPQRIILSSSSSPGNEYDWSRIRKELEDDIEELDQI